MKRMLLIISATFLMMGCPPTGGNTAKVEPKVTADAPVTAETIESLSQQITQLQYTMNTQTTNYQRDAEQAKTDRRVFGCLIAVIAAFGIVGFCTKICLTGIYRMVALGVAAVLIAGGVMFLMW